MQVSDFPQKYKSQLEKNAVQKISDERANSNRRIESLYAQRYSQPKEDGLGTGMIIGFFGGFFVCCGVCFNSDIGAGIVTWIICVVIGLIAGGQIDSNAKSSWQSNNVRVDSGIEKEKKGLEREIKEINRKVEEEYIQYCVAFDKEAQKLSVNYANSHLAREVIDWMTAGLCEYIDAADRRSHIEIINVPFVFNVYKDKITCNIGTYDFEIKRCRKLDNPLEQVALARCIAVEIKLGVMIKYNKDEDEKKISVNIEYKYTESYPSVVITYVEPNSNYKPVKDW